MYSLLRQLLPAYAMLCLSQSSIAQKAAITGNIADELKGPITGAGMELCAEAGSKEIIKHTISDVDGHFSFHSLHPGYYRLCITYLAGSRTLIITGIKIGRATINLPVVFPIRSLSTDLPTSQGKRGWCGTLPLSMAEVKRDTIYQRWLAKTPE